MQTKASSQMVLKTHWRRRFRWTVFASRQETLSSADVRQDVITRRVRTVSYGKANEKLDNRVAVELRDDQHSSSCEVA
jgi:hypothetical protein